MTARLFSLYSYAFRCEEAIGAHETDGLDAKADGRRP
jgi:hypothetical protein